MLFGNLTWHWNLTWMAEDKSTRTEYGIRDESGDGKSPVPRPSSMSFLERYNFQKEVQRKLEKKSGLSLKHPLQTPHQVSALFALSCALCPLPLSHVCPSQALLQAIPSLARSAPGPHRFGPMAAGSGLKRKCQPLYHLALRKSVDFCWLG
jgi:hypothetical protein